MMPYNAPVVVDELVVEGAKVNEDGQAARDGLLP